MISRTLVALALATCSVGSFAASSDIGTSGSIGFQVGSQTTTSTTSSSALSGLVPVSFSSVSVTVGGTVVVLAVNAPAGAAITQLAGAGSFTGQGTYVLTDANGNSVTIVVDAEGNISSITEGDNA